MWEPRSLAGCGGSANAGPCRPLAWSQAHREDEDEKARIIRTAVGPHRAQQDALEKLAQAKLLQQVHASELAARAAARVALPAVPHGQFDGEARLFLFLRGEPRDEREGRRSKKRPRDRGRRHAEGLGGKGVRGYPTRDRESPANLPGVR